MMVRIRVGICDSCQQSATVRYRIQHDPSGQWRLVCPDCRRTLAADNPYYRYGGTWKAKKHK